MAAPPEPHDVPGPLEPPEKPPESRAGLLLTDRMLTIFISLLVLTQAALAGHSRRLGGSINIEIHGMVGNGVFTLLIVSAVIATVTRAGTARLATLAALIVLATAQIGLGYVGRTSTEAAGWHVPLGVAIFGLTIYNLVLNRAQHARRDLGDS